MNKYEMIELTKQAVENTKKMLDKQRENAIYGLEEAINDSVNGDYIVVFHTHYEAPTISVIKQSKRITIELSNNDAEIIALENISYDEADKIVSAVIGWMGGE